MKKYMIMTAIALAMSLTAGCDYSNYSLSLR